MSTVKTILSIVVIFVLASCGTSTPAANLTPIPTNIPHSTAEAMATATATATVMATPAPKDVPIYRNSFEGITDLAASGITSASDVTLNTDNFNYPGGGTALEINGVLQGAQNSNLYVDFSVKELTGENSLDLTNKTIYYSAYIPADSAIDNISVYAGKGGQFVQLGGITADDYWKKGAWHDYQFDLTTVQGLMKDSDTIRIVGQRLADGDPITDYFLVDDLKWIGSDIFNVPVDNNVDSLRKYAANKHFEFGLWAGNRYLYGDGHTQKDPWYVYMAAQEGAVNAVWNFLSKENENYSNFDYDRPEDAFLLGQYQYGEGNSMATLGYGIGGWGGPQWIRDLAFPDATQAFLLYHVEKDLRYTKGQNPIWILFNEPVFFFSGNGYGLKNRQETGDDYSPWAANRTDFSLIKAAFIKAREVDPNATLMINDGSNEDIGWVRSDLYYQIASDLKAQGIPIDGVGFQMHNYIDPNGKLVVFREALPWDYSNTQRMDLDTYLNNVELNVKRYASIGLKVAFTEVEGQIKFDDIDFATLAGRAEYEKRLQWQAKYFAGLLRIALENDNVIMFHMWGVTDRYQNVQPWPGYGNGFIFDKNFNPKPAYYAMLELLKAP